MNTGNPERDSVSNQNSAEHNQIWLPPHSRRMSRGKFLAVTSSLLATLALPQTTLAQEDEEAEQATEPVVAQSGKWSSVIHRNPLTAQNESWEIPTDHDPNSFTFEFTPQGYVLKLHEQPGPKTMVTSSKVGFRGPRRARITTELLETSDESPQAIRMGSKVLRFGFNPLSGAYQVQEFHPDTTEFIGVVKQGRSESVQRGNEPLMLTWQTEGTEYLGSISTVSGEELARLTGEHPLAAHEGNIWIGLTKQGNGSMTTAFRNLTVSR